MEEDRRDVLAGLHRQPAPGQDRLAQDEVRFREHP